MQKEKELSLQEWLPFECILDAGIVLLKNSEYIKIIEVIPINYDLKSELEKEAILNSYKIFLKTCNFDLQILIQSNKEDLSNHISTINIQLKNEKNLEIKEISKNYINFIQNINKEKKSSSKNFYILIKNSLKNLKLENINSEEIIIEELNEKFFKIKECLSRCGNITLEYDKKEEIKEILYSFLNVKNSLNYN
ncbi:MAG: hypothetical protein HFJ24_03635 [Clostridia bacterium]|nr:hypothetical protein [Clostridia bacterium]